MYFGMSSSSPYRQLSNITPEDQAKLTNTGNLVEKKVESEDVDQPQRESTADQILNRENPNRPAIVKATPQSNRAEMWDEKKAMFADFAKNIFKNSWNTNEDKEVDDKTHTEPTPRTPVQMEEARRRNLMKDWVRDSLNNESVFKMAKFGLNKPEQYLEIMKLRTQSHKNHIRRIIYLTIGEYFKQKKYEYSIPYTVEHNKVAFQPILDKMKNAKEMTEAEKREVVAEFEALFKTLRKQPPQYANFEDTTPEKTAYSQAAREEEWLKEEQELAQRYQENHATNRDIRTPSFRGVSRNLIKTYVTLQHIRIRLQRKSVISKNDKEMEKVLEVQESKLKRISASINEIIPGENIKEDG
jgi:hypothetical protein